MIGWECAIEDCNAGFASAEELIAHQRDEHADHECRICGTTVPDGYPAISHAFGEHTRAQYVRAYNADARAIRLREAVLERVESALDGSLTAGESEQGPR